MSDEQSVSDMTGDADTAGGMLRRAREQQGMHIAMLASIMKVTPKKLEALEGNRLNELPDLAFARALAQSVCRTLKTDPDPILARLPALAKPEGLEHATNGLAAPFREHGDSHTDGSFWAFLTRPVFWAIAAVLAAAAVMAFAPKTWLQRFTSSAGDGAKTTMGVASAAAGTAATPKVVSEPLQPLSDKPVVMTSPVVVAPVTTTKAAELMGPARPEPSSGVLVETVHSAPASNAASSSPQSSGDPSGLIVVRAKAEAWVEVVDGKGRSMIARSLQPDETIGIDGDPPFKVRLGNVGNTELRYRGEPVDVSTRSVGNTIRLELK